MKAPRPVARLAHRADLPPLRRPGRRLPDHWLVRRTTRPSTGQLPALRPAAGAGRRSALDRALRCADREPAARVAPPRVRHRRRAPERLPEDFAALGVTMFRSTVLTMRREQLRPARKPLSVRLLRCARCACRRSAARWTCSRATPTATSPRATASSANARWRVLRPHGRRRPGRGFGIFAATAQGERASSPMRAVPRRLRRARSAASSSSRRIRTGAATACTARSSTPAAGTASKPWVWRRWSSLPILRDVAIGLYESLGFVRDHELWYLDAGRRPIVAQADAAQQSMFARHRAMPARCRECGRHLAPRRPRISAAGAFVPSAGKISPAYFRSKSSVGSSVKSSGMCARWKSIPSRRARK